MLAVGLLPGLATAAPRVHLEYRVDPSLDDCPGEDELLSAVRERLGADPFSADAGFTLSTEIAPDGTRIHAVLTVRDASGALVGVRELARPGSCRELFPAIVLAVTLTTEGLEPAVAHASDAEEPVVEEPVVTHPAADLAVAVAVSHPSAWHVEAGVCTGLGAAPGVSTGVTLQAGLRRGALSAALEARADLPAARDYGGGSVSAQSVGLYLVGCRHAGPLAACALGGGGALVGAGHGLVNARSVAVPLAVVGARFLWETDIGHHLGLGVHLDLHAPLTRTTLTVSGENAWTTPGVAGAFGVTLARHFP